MEYEQEALNLIARRRRGKQTTRHSCSTFSFSFFFFFYFLSLPFSYFLFFFFLSFFLPGIYCFNNSSNAVGCKWTYGGSWNGSRSLENLYNTVCEKTLLSRTHCWKLSSRVIVDFKKNFLESLSICYLSKKYLISFESLKSISFLFLFLNKNC